MICRKRTLLEELQRLTKTHPDSFFAPFNQRQYIATARKIISDINGSKANYSLNDILTVFDPNSKINKIISKHHEELPDNLVIQMNQYSKEALQRELDYKNAVNALTWEHELRQLR